MSIEPVRAGLLAIVLAASWEQEDPETTNAVLTALETVNITKRPIRDAGKSTLQFSTKALEIANIGTQFWWECSRDAETMLLALQLVDSQKAFKLCVDFFQYFYNWPSSLDFELLLDALRDPNATEAYVLETLEELGRNRRFYLNQAAQALAYLKFDLENAGYIRWFFTDIDRCIGTALETRKKQAAFIRTCADCPPFEAFLNVPE